MAPGSPADRNTLRPGDRLLRINGQVIGDHIDYRYHASEETLLVEVERQGQPVVATVCKEIDEDLGLELKEPRYKTCQNKCIFCFVSQMPSGLRRSLYVKDDDYRLSFMHGNYITLTNLEEHNFRRIFQQHLSPLYVSVHATDDNIRREILGNPAAPSLLPILK
ncbi:MAG: PDZ domain-containing protein, partial [bacterium]|nr:PDZ domain-containing protein [bacterium]